MAADAVYMQPICQRVASARRYRGQWARPASGRRPSAAGRVWPQSGFSLTEVLVTMVLLAIGFLGLSALSLGTIRGVAQSETLTLATILARDKTEQIMHASYDQVVAGNYPLEAYHTLAGYERFQRSVAINDNVPQANMKTILVTVSWQDSQAQTHAFTLTSTMIQH